MFQFQNKPRFIYPFVIVCISVVMLFAFFVTMQKQRAHADAAFQVEFRGEGFFGVASGGVGTRGVPATGDWTGSGEFTLDIPISATVSKARMIWTGRSTNFDADGVRLAVDGTDLGVFNADLQFQQFPWCCSGAGQIHESVDVSAYVLPGVHTYTISDHEHGLIPIADNLNYGVGIWAVYSITPTDFISAELGSSETVVYQGQDSFFRLWDPPRGPHTEVRCAEFNASAEARDVDLVHLVSGVDPWDTATNSVRQRSVAVWYESGTGTPPPKDEIDFGSGDKTPSLALRPDAVGHDASVVGQYPLQSYAGLEWDNFSIAGLSVPANHTWLCFQIESGDSQDLAGLGNVGLDASGMWNLFAIDFPNPIPPSAVALVSFDATAVSRKHIRVDWQTASEINNFGFNLYRHTINDFTTAELIHFEPGDTANAGGASYRFDDFAPRIGSNYYWLEDIDNSSGEATRYGPVQVEISLIEMIFLPLLRN